MSESESSEPTTPSVTITVRLPSDNEIKVNVRLTDDFESLKKILSERENLNSRQTLKFKGQLLEGNKCYNDYGITNGDAIHCYCTDVFEEDIGIIETVPFDSTSRRTSQVSSHATSSRRSVGTSDPQASLPPNILEYTIEHVGEFLQSLGFESFQSSFLSAGVNGEVLCGLRIDDLTKELGMSSLQARKVIDTVAEKKLVGKQRVFDGLVAQAGLEPALEDALHRLSIGLIDFFSSSTLADSQDKEIEVSETLKLLTFIMTSQQKQFKEAQEAMEKEMVETQKVFATMKAQLEEREKASNSQQLQQEIADKTAQISRLETRLRSLESQAVNETAPTCMQADLCCVDDPNLAKKLYDKALAKDSCFVPALLGQLVHAQHYRLLTKNNAEVTALVARVRNAGEENTLAAKAYYENIANSKPRPFVFFQIGHWYEVSKSDPSRAFQWYKKAADMGLHLAQFTVGRSYQLGQVPSIEKSATEAAEWFRKAASQGFSRAQFCLAELALLGDGMERNLEEALSLYKAAAEKKHAMACFNLGVMYAGVHAVPGLEKNLGQAVVYLTKGAEENHAGCWLALGQCYQEGGVWGSDSNKAVECYVRAAVLGNSKAREHLEVLWQPDSE